MPAERRYFEIELGDRIKLESVNRFLKPADPTRLTCDAGIIQGMQMALDLAQEIRKHNTREDDDR